MSTGVAILTWGHVALSLAGIASGFVVLGGFLAARRSDPWTSVFLSTTIATSLTGFFFPVDRFMPSHAVGILSLLALPVAIFALYKRRLVRAWRPWYVITSMIALYLNVFVLVAQLFAKAPPLHALAPNPNEPPFIIAQSIVLVAFVILAAAAVVRFHPGRASAPASTA
jgi:hypothetical protein